MVVSISVLRVGSDRIPVRRLRLRILLQMVGEELRPWGLQKKYGVEFYSYATMKEDADALAACRLALATLPAERRR